MMHDFWTGGEYGMFFMMFLWIVVIVAIFLLVKWVIDQSRGSSALAQESDAALDLLKERYARGEIDKDEFEQKKRDLI